MRKELALFPRNKVSPANKLKGDTENAAFSELVSHPVLGSVFPGVDVRILCSREHCNGL